MGLSTSRPDPRVGADGANTNSFFNDDHVHPNLSGQQLLANAASNALNYYFGATSGNPTVVTSLPYAMAPGDGYVSLNGLGSAGALTLPDCTGQSGASYQVNNPQSTYAVTIGPLNKRAGDQWAGEWGRRSGERDGDAAGCAECEVGGWLPLGDVVPGDWQVTASAD